MNNDDIKEVKAGNLHELHVHYAKNMPLSGNSSWVVPRYQ